MAFKSAYSVKYKIVVDNKVLKQSVTVSMFNCSECDLRFDLIKTVVTVSTVRKQISFRNTEFQDSRSGEALQTAEMKILREV